MEKDSLLWMLLLMSACLRCVPESWKFCDNHPCDAAPPDDRPTLDTWIDTAAATDLGSQDEDVRACGFVGAPCCLSGNPCDNGLNCQPSGSCIRPTMPDLHCGAGSGPCNPIDPTSCGSGQMCVLRSAPFACATAGSSGRGTACTATTQCRPGFACIPEGSGHCYKLCCSGDDAWCQDVPSGGTPGSQCRGMIPYDIEYCTP